MATVFYDKAAVKVTVANVSEVLLASDCSVTFSNSQQPFYAIGNKGALGQFPNAARQGDVSFSFLKPMFIHFIKGRSNHFGHF